VHSSESKLLITARSSRRTKLITKSVWTFGRLLCCLKLRARHGPMAEHTTVHIDVCSTRYRFFVRVTHRAATTSARNLLLATRPLQIWNKLSQMLLKPGNVALCAGHRRGKMNWHMANRTRRSLKICFYCILAPCLRRHKSGLLELRDKLNLG
jgi:hypothetical protein